MAASDAFEIATDGALTDAGRLRTPALVVAAVRAALDADGGDDPTALAADVAAWALEANDDTPPARRRAVAAALLAAWPPRLRAWPWVAGRGQSQALVSAPCGWRPVGL